MGKRYPAVVLNHSSVINHSCGINHPELSTSSFHSTDPQQLLEVPEGRVRSPLTLEDVSIGEAHPQQRVVVLPHLPLLVLLAHGSGPQHRRLLHRLCPAGTDTLVGPEESHQLLAWLLSPGPAAALTGAAAPCAAPLQ